jgi:IS5 family transposase
MSRIPEPQISFADCVFREQKIFLDPLLQTISDFLEGQQKMIEQVRRDLEQGLKKPHTGRSGLTPSQVLRSLVLMRVKNWNYRELQERIADGYTLRSFTDFRSQPVPKHDAFHRAFSRLTSKTLQQVNALVLKAAMDLGLEEGEKLRVDTTVVQTNIHYPTDSTLLWDTVRVITRVVGQLHQEIPQGVQGFTHRTRAARRRMQALQRMTAQQRQQQQTKKYRELIAITERVVASARQVREQTRKARGQDLRSDFTIARLRQELDHYCQLGDRVMDQARRRVLLGQPVPTEQKIYSIFEPHTDLIKRGKQQTPVEFGHKVFLAESAQGFITQYVVLKGNPADEDHVLRSLQQHKQIFGHPPEWYSSDRGFYSDHNVRACQQHGIAVVSIPQRGGKKTPARQAYEKTPAFKKAQRFRAGIEGRISVLFRGRGMKRCLARGRERFELFVGAAVLANNLLRLATLLMEGSPRKRKAA